MTHSQFDRTHWHLIETDHELREAAERISAGSGPIGIDTERASGHRYFSNAYLVQVHRRGAGTFLVDPTSITSLTPLAQSLHDELWILHAASTDLPSLGELGLRPSNLFDTELASRLLGIERVSLGAIVEGFLGITLAKAHSAADWSKRPLPESWLEYAALDVVYLPDLHDALREQLFEAGKTEFAQQEFAAIIAKPEKEPALDPWRKLSRLSDVKSLTGLAVAKELWLTRDEYARSIDRAPGRLIPDRSIVAASLQLPRSADELSRNKQFSGPASRTELARWWRAIVRGKQSPPPARRAPTLPGTIPHHRHWERRNPEAHARLGAARALLEAEAEAQRMPLENLLTPAVLRELAWQPPQPVAVDEVSVRLLELGARPWQVHITAPLVTAAFVEYP